MIRSRKSAVLTFALAAALPALALAHNHEATKKEAAAPPEMSAEEKAMMEAFAKAGAPGDVHATLAKMEGNYDLVIKSWDKPGGEPIVEKGTGSRKMVLGGRVMVEQVQSKMWGQPFEGHGMHGYDNVSGKHWATWNDSMSTGVMISEGDCDDKGNCSFTGSWNDPITKGKTIARMKSSWPNANTQLFEMHAPGPDGKEFKMMEITYTRKQ